MFAASFGREVAGEKVCDVTQCRAALGKLPVDNGDWTPIGEVEEHVIQPIVGMRERQRPTFNLLSKLREGLTKLLTDGKNLGGNLVAVSLDERRP